MLETISSDSSQYLNEGIEMQKNFLWIRRSHSLICKDQNTSTDCSFKDTVNCCAKIAEPCRYCVYSISRIDFIILLKIVPYPNEEDLTALLPALFLVMYFGSLGKAIVQMVLLTVTSPCFTILLSGERNDPQWV